MTVQLMRFFREALVSRADIPVARARFRVRALFVADIHACAAFSRRALPLLAAQMRALSPELLLVGGDLGESRGDALDALKMLASVGAPLGVFASPGNNDAEAFGSDEAAREAARPFGIRMLVNETARLPVGGARLWIGGLGELKHGAADAAGFFEEAGEGDVKLLLSHYPHAVPDAVLSCARKPDLALCGHTHGGQIALFGKTAFDFCYEAGLGKVPLLRGMGELNGVPTLVTDGIGTSRMPLRVNAPPQIHLLTIGSPESQRTIE